MALRILLADSNIATQNMGMKILLAAGHEVVTVSNGLAAFRNVAECVPEVLLLDVHLPGYGGVEICEQLKAKPETGAVPVLLTIGRMELFSASECVKAKADGVITKPFEASELIAAMERVAERMHPTDDGQRVAGSRVTAVPPVQEFNGATSPAPTQGCAFLPQQNEEVCDVCGHVNREHAFACGNCDVPLPSTVRH